MRNRKPYRTLLFAGLLLSFAASLARAHATVPQPDGAGVASTVGAAAANQQSPESLDQRILELQSQLARVEEEVARVNRERAEWLARLDDLDAQIILARQLVASRSQQLAPLQANLAVEARQQARLEAGQEAAVVAAAEAEAETAARAEREAAAEGSLFSPATIVIGGALLLLGLAVLRMLRATGPEQNATRKATVTPPGYTDNKTAQKTKKHAEVGTNTEREEFPTDRGVQDHSDDFGEETFRIEPGGGPEDAAEIPPPEGEYVDDPNPPQDPGEIPDDEDDSDADDDYVIELDNGDEEEIAERLNLAYSFHRMGDSEQARRILEQVIRVGNEAQVSEARQLLAIIHDLN